MLLLFSWDCRSLINVLSWWLLNLERFRSTPSEGPSTISARVTVVPISWLCFGSMKYSLSFLSSWFIVLIKIINVLFISTVLLAEKVQSGQDQNYWIDKEWRITHFYWLEVWPKRIVVLPCNIPTRKGYMCIYINTGGLFVCLSTEQGYIIKERLCI